MKQPIKIVASCALLSAFSLAVGACGSSTDGLDQVTLRLDYTMNGYDAPWVYGKEAGIFEDQGIDLKIEEGKASATTIKTVAAGKDDFGLAGANIISSAITNEDADIITLGSYVQQTPLGFNYHSAHPVESGDDLKGRTIYTQPGFTGASLLPLVFKKLGVNEEDVTVQSADPKVIDAKFTAEPEAISTGFINGDAIRQRLASKDVKSISWKEFDVNMMATSLVGSKSRIENDDDVTSRFMAATTQSWQEASNDVSGAIDAVMDNYPNEEEEVMREGLQTSLDLSKGEGLGDKPYGWMSEDAWREMNNNLNQYGGMKTPKEPENYFTNEYITTD